MTRSFSPSGFTAVLLVAFCLMLVGCDSLHIWQAAEFGKNHEINRLLDENPRLINAKDESGWTPLMHAVSGGKETTVKLLLDRGADPRIKADSNWDAIHEAKQHDNSKIRKIIETAIEEANELDAKKPKS